MLRELQREFIAALHGNSVLPAQHMATPSARGFAVYRNNFLIGTQKALALDFPVVQRLVGTDCFAALCRDYRQAWPSTSGDLQHLGARFPEFLHVRFGAGEHAYLGDVARLERAMDECLVAAADMPADIQSLAGIDPAELGDVNLPLHCAVRLVRSPWPVDVIWHAHRAVGEPDVVDLAGGGVDVVVQRQASGIVLRRVDARAFDFLRALDNHAPLAHACTTVFGADDAAAGRALADAFAWGLIGSHPVHTPHDRPTGVDP